ncbi:phosphotransferase [Clostridium isatidis]|uniref:phosphotransferase n=1 Tax=Clostridium isatidis TaxID=182773 RepID=UPI003AAB2AC9
MREIGKFIGRDNQSKVYKNKEYAIKVFNPGCDKTSVFYEATVASLMEEIGLPVAKIHEVIKIENQWAIKMDYIEGMDLGECIKQDRENLASYLEIMVDLQIFIQQIKVHLSFNLHDSLKEKIENSNFIDELTKNKLLVKLNNLPRGSGLCHGDFNPFNIMKDKNEYFVINWIKAANGSQEADACKTYMSLALIDEEMADLYLEIYSNKSKKCKQDILEWLPILAVPILDERKEEDKDKLLSWINTI